MGRVCQTDNFLSIEIFVSKALTFIEARYADSHYYKWWRTEHFHIFYFSIFRDIENIDRSHSHGNKRLDEFSDGQEILNIHLAEKLFRFFLSKVYTGKSF